MIILLEEAYKDGGVKNKLFQYLYERLLEGIDYAYMAPRYPDLYLYGVSQCPSWEQNPGRFDECVKSDPWTAIAVVKDRLTPVQLEYCLREDPIAGIYFVPELMKPGYFEKPVLEYLHHKLELCKIGNRLGLEDISLCQSRIDDFLRD